MKQTVGVGVILALAVAATTRYSGGPTTTTPVPGSGLVLPSARPVQPVQDLSTATYRGGCTAFDPEDPKATYPKDNDRGDAKSILDQFFSLKPDVPSSITLKAANYTGLHYAIAVAPDPKHTNLSLSFDREMVLVQQAAQDEGYTYNSSWLPWKGDGPSFPLLPDQQRTEDQTSSREACPGILLFRRSVNEPQPNEPIKPFAPYEEALVVFIVGEQPTAGINEDQWANTIHWLAMNVPAPPGALSILGPTFSGSLVSMQRDLAHIYHDTPTNPEAGKMLGLFPTVHLLSGGVSGCSSIRWFERQLEDPGFHNRITFGSFAENDELQIYRFLSYIHAERTDVRDVTILSEDETAYANESPASDSASQSIGAAKPCSFHYDPQDRPVRLSYPRDISALRSAYDKQSVFGSPSQGARTAHPILQENPELEGENENASDTIHSYSGSLSAVAQEAVLYGIVSNLRSHHTRYLLLRCSNPLDFLFLTRFFHRAYPEARVVTVTSDLLFRREIDTTEFRGVLALANYALLPRNQHWSRLSEQNSPTSHTHRIFDSNNEGSYIAARYLFHTGVTWPAHDSLAAALTLPFIENIPDYADPFWMHRPNDPIPDSNAPIWLSVLGRDGYWPIAVLRAHEKIDLGTPPSSPPSTIIRLHSKGPKAHYDLAPGTSGRGARFSDSLLFKLPLSWSISVVLALALLFYQLFAIASDSGFTSSGLFAPFRQIRDNLSQALLLGINSTFATMPALLLFSVAIVVPRISDLDEAVTGLWVWVGFCTLFIVALSASLVIQFRKRTVEMRPGGLFAASTFLLTLIVLVVLASATLRGSIDDLNSAPLFLRMVHLTSGVSPLTPILFLFVGFYLWTWQALAGNVLLSDGRPLLPAFSGTQKVVGSLNRLYCWLRGLPLTNNGPATYSLASTEYRLSEEIAKRIINVASPACVDLRIVVLPAALAAAAVYYFPPTRLPLLSVEGHGYSIWINFALLMAFLVTTAEALRLYSTWIELNRLLLALNRRPLRRTFARLRDIAPGSLWSVSGNVQRVQFLFFAHQMDAARRLQTYTGAILPKLLEALEYGHRFTINSAEKVSAGARWEMPIKFQNNSEPASIRIVLADAVADVINEVLVPNWANEEASLNLDCSDAASVSSGGERSPFGLPLSKDQAIRAAEEFVCFHYIAFIQNVLARMRTMILSMVFLFVSVCLAISFYPFVPRTQIGLWMTVNLALIATSVIYVYAGMERDETLSYITNTPPGRLSSEFYIRTATFLAGPVIGLLTTQFPAISESVLGWLQPGLDALK